MAAGTGSGELLLVEGHAGIGKSALLDEAVARARAAGMTVMRARAAELEGDFQFGIALQLFEPMLTGADDDIHERLLAGTAALAGPLLERPTTWAGDEEESRSYPVMHGLFWVLSNLAETGPVLIAIDDVHWADRASLRLVLYLLQRLEEMAVSIVVARRLGEPGAPEDLLAQISSHAASRSVRPAPLSRAGTRRLVGEAMRDADAAFADACWRMTEGNIFLLEELIAAVRDEGWQPTAQNAARIGTLAPEAVLRAVAVRLMRLSDDAAGVARAVAVLGDDAQLRHVAALSNRGGERVAAAADALAASDILRPVDTGALRFAHTLLASAVYADIATAERATLHRRAAEILHGEGVAPERIAAHLLPSPGSAEPWVVDLLCAAAQHALAAGAPESAASYLCRALQEPPRAGRRAAVLRELGASEAATGLPSAIEHLEEALAADESAPGDPARARTLLALGRALAAAGRHTDALARFDEAAAGAPGSDAEAAVVGQARAEAGTLGVLDPLRRAALLEPARAGAGERGIAGAAANRPLLATRCVHRALLGAPRDEILALARAAAAAGREEAFVAQGAGATVPIATSVALLACDELLWSEREMTTTLDRARASGSTVAFATASLVRAAARWAPGPPRRRAGRRRAGARRAALRLAAPAAVRLRRGRRPARRARRPRRGGRDRRALRRVQTVRLRGLGAAGAVARGAGPAGAGRAPRGRRAGALRGLARRRHGRRQPRVRRRLALGVGARAREPRPPGRGARARPRGARARPRLRRPARDQRRAASARPRRRATARSSARSRCSRRRSAPWPAPRRGWSCAARSSSSARCCGGRGGARTPAGCSATRSRSPAPAARSCSRSACIEELEVAGTRMQRAARRGADALSPSERRVVALAIEGLSNRQIAEALFVTRKAVEWHLGNAYRKLDVRSRHELPGALSDSR